MGKIHVEKEINLTVEKDPLKLVLPYLGSMSSQTRTKLKKPLKNILIGVSCRFQQFSFQGSDSQRS